MDRLWTPWRMEYIKDTGREEGCIFCELPEAGDDPASLILARGPLAFVILNKYPYNSGHVMVAPFRHVADLQSLEAEEIAEIMEWTQKIMAVLDETTHPQGYNIGVNQGRVAGAGIVDHIHLHVVPRWGGDTNFMSTVGDSKVLPESLDQTYDKLKPHLA